MAKGMARLDLGLSHCKLKTLTKTKFANKLIMFQKTLKYRDVIVMGGKKFKNYKDVCQIHTHEHFAK
jgi:hypothetical protein